MPVTHTEISSPPTSCLSEDVVVCIDFGTARKKDVFSLNQERCASMAYDLVSLGAMVASLQLVVPYRETERERE